LGDDSTGKSRFMEKSAMFGTRITRRRFLAGTAAAGAFATLDATTRASGTNERIGVGVIGVGGRGSELLRLALKRAEAKRDVQILAVCDVYQRRLNAAASSAKGAKPYVRHQDLLARDDIDAVIIATPDHWHAPIALAAMDAGMDVYVEKPMTLTVEEATEVARKAKEKDRVVQVGAQALSWRKWARARDAIAKGMLGRVVCCQGSYSRNDPKGDWNWPIEPGAGPAGTGDDRIDWDQWLGPAPKRPYDADRFFRFRKYWDYSGGIATDLHYHVVAPYHMIVRNEHPTRVVGAGGLWVHNDGREVPDTFLTAADYPSKFSVTVQSTQANSVGFPPLIRGEEATMFCGADWEGQKLDHIRIVPEAPFRDAFKKKWGKDEVDLSDDSSDGDMPHMDNFFDCVRSRKQPNCNADLGYKVMVTIGLSVRSYREGKVFFFDAKRGEVLERPPA
jgi:predicted dehydrogenase